MPKKTKTITIEVPVCLLFALRQAIVDEKRVRESNLKSAIRKKKHPELIASVRARRDNTEKLLAVVLDQIQPTMDDINRKKDEANAASVSQELK